MGYPPLVTPTSQVLGAQAIANVLAEERWAEVLPETRDYFLGLFGEPPGKLDARVRKLALGNEEPITVRPADLLDPLLDRAKKDLKKAGIATESPDDLLSFILFPVAALRFLRGEGGEEKIVARKAARAEAPPALAPAGEYRVEVDGESFSVRVFGGGMLAAAAAPGGPPVEAAAVAPPSPRPGPGVSPDGALTAPMQGLILKVLVAAGDKVKLGQAVVVLEAMKMQNDVTATKSGTVKDVYVAEGSVVTPGQALMVIE
jgi:pyruvate carboxylase subunit B